MISKIRQSPHRDRDRRIFASRTRHKTHATTTIIARMDNGTGAGKRRQREDDVDERQRGEENDQANPRFSAASESVALNDT